MPAPWSIVHACFWTNPWRRWITRKCAEQMQIELIGLQMEVGITFIYVTHDQGEALALSTRLAVMNNGRIEQIGDPSDVYMSFRTPGSLRTS